MSDPKAERLAAIRAANVQRHVSSPPVADSPTVSPAIAPQTPVTVETVRLAQMPGPVAAPTTGDSGQDPSLAIGTIGLIALSAMGGALLAVVLPTLLPGLTASLLGPEPKVYWYLSRSTAFVAYGLLWLSMALGLMMTNKLARLWPGGPVAFELHEHTSILGLAFGLFHALILLGDGYANYTLGQILIPFASGGSAPFWVGLGQVGLYLMAIVGLSFYVRPLIGRAGWRLIHFLSFVIFALALFHGVQSGTDSGTALAQGIYWFSGASLLFLTIYRVLVSVMTPAPTARPAARA
jgi:predicted ferric reductase